MRGGSFEGQASRSCELDGVLLSPHSPPILVDAVRGIAQWLLVVPVVLTLWLVVEWRQWQADIIEGVLAGILTVAFVKLGAASYVHARPFIVYGRLPLVLHAPDNAFPSDHLAACGLLFGYIWPRSRLFTFIVLICAALIGAARVLAGLHWPVDIVAGFLLGLLAAFAAGFVRSYNRRWQ